MRVCFVIYGSLEQVTGGYAYDRRIVAGLRAAGDTVDVVSLDELANLPRSERIRRALNDGALTGHPDVVVGDELCHRELALLFRYMRASYSHAVSRPRRVLLVHHLSQWETGVPLATESRVIGLSDAIVVTSEDSAERLRNGFGASSAVCVPGADHLPRLPRQLSHGAVLRLLYVGTWTERKGLLRLLHALRGCPEANYELTIVGDAHRDEAYRERVLQCIQQSAQLKQRCHVLGILTDELLAEVYATHDILALPSEYEGYGMVLAEAARAGLGIICGKAGGTLEASHHAAQVLWVQPEDESSLREALRGVIAAHPAVTDPAASEFERRVAFPTWGTCVARFRQVLLETVVNNT